MIAFEEEREKLKQKQKKWPQKVFIRGIWSVCTQRRILKIEFNSFWKESWNTLVRKYKAIFHPQKCLLEKIPDFYPAVILKRQILIDMHVHECVCAWIDTVKILQAWLMTNKC